MHKTDDSKHSVTASISLTGAMFLVFMTLKLTGDIAWSWWWVTAPLWIPVGLVLAVVAVALVVAGVGALFHRERTGGL